MSAPTYSLSRLTLEAMSPTTRSQGREASPAASSRYADESSSDFDSDLDESALEDEDDDVVRSPTKLIYRLDHLSEDAKTVVRDAFTDPPKIALQRCRLINNTYAFQMTELVTRSIRIRAPEEGAAHLRCSCGEEDLCEHLVWLLDQILKQTLYDHEDDKPLTMTKKGCAEEMGDPFHNIADYHLDILAGGLHCHLVDPDANPEDEVDPQRVLESQELLSAVHVVPPDEFRSDIFTNPGHGKKVLKRHDLDRTIFRMLLDNHHFFHYFISQCPKTDPIHDPFRKVLQRVEHVLRDLDFYSSNSSSNLASSSSSGSVSEIQFAESPRDVPWAAKHILGSVRRIRSAIYTRDKPLQPQEAISAARTLVRILSAVVARNRDANTGSTRRDRNLYWRLVGDQDFDFVIAELNLLPEAASQFLHNLETILDQMGAYGAPATYVEKFRNLLGRLRTSNTGSALKRQVQGQGSDRRSKRMK